MILHNSRINTRKSFLYPTLYQTEAKRKSLQLRRNQSLRAGFELTREAPTGFQVQSVNHSAIAAVISKNCQYLECEVLFVLACGVSDKKHFSTLVSLETTLK